MKLCKTVRSDSFQSEKPQPPLFTAASQVSYGNNPSMDIVATARGLVNIKLSCI